MTGDVTIQSTQDQLCLQLRGDVSNLPWCEIWQQLEAKVESCQPQQMLIEAQVSRWPSIVQLYGWPQRLRETGVREICRIAICDTNPATQRDAHFLDCVLHNQGFCFSTVCDNVADAGAWLSRQPA